MAPYKEGMMTLSRKKRGLIEWLSKGLALGTLLYLMAYYLKLFNTLTSRGEGVVFVLIGLLTLLSVALLGLWRWQKESNWLKVSFFPLVALVMMVLHLFLILN